MAKQPASKKSRSEKVQARASADYHKKMEELLRERERTEHSKMKLKGMTDLKGVKK